MWGTQSVEGKEGSVRGGTPPCLLQNGHDERDIRFPKHSLELSFSPFLGYTRTAVYRTVTAKRRKSDPSSATLMSRKGHTFKSATASGSP